MMSKKSAIVLGPTGMVGRKVVDQLLADDAFSKVSILTRKTLNLKESDGQPLKKLNEVIVNYENGINDTDVRDHDVMFMCLGTTRAQAGSAEAFIKIDYDYPLMAAKHHTGRDVVLLTATGSDANSWFLYPRTKGLLEKAFIDMKFKNLAILQPGLLMLEGQERENPRFFEALSIKFVSALGITTGTASISKVASAMIAAAKLFSSTNTEPTVKVYSNNDILRS